MDLNKETVAKELQTAVDTLIGNEPSKYKVTLRYKMGEPSVITEGEPFNPWPIEVREVREEK